MNVKKHEMRSHGVAEHMILLKEPKLIVDVKRKSKFVVFFACLVNVVSSLSIVLLNKHIYVSHGFPNMTLTCIHFIVTFLGSLLCLMLGLFEYKKLKIRKMIPLSLTFCGFVVFTNLSLQYNTVGTYQVIKVLTTPCVMIISYIHYQKKYSLKTMLTVVPIFVGVYLSSYYDLKFNIIGIILALIGVAITSLYQVWVGEKQKEHQVNSMQLLLYQAPISAVILALIIPFFEPMYGPKGVFSSDWSLDSLTTVISSGVVAFGVNLSIYWIIGQFSALSYNMVGHFKFGLIVFSGSLLFKDPITVNQFIGMLISVSGVIAYSLISH